MPDERRREYQVGFGKPPASTRFKKGQSGNPKGRPRGSKNLATELADALNERVAISENGKRKTITKRRAGAKQFANKVAIGDPKAFQILLDHDRRAEDRGLGASVAERINEEDQAVLQGILERLRNQNEEKGETGNGDSETE